MRIWTMRIAWGYACTKKPLATARKTNRDVGTRPPFPIPFYGATVLAACGRRRLQSSTRRQADAPGS